VETAAGGKTTDGLSQRAEFAALVLHSSRDLISSFTLSPPSPTNMRSYADSVKFEGVRCMARVLVIPEGTQTCCRRQVGMSPRWHFTI